jgi:hypothetical protein
MKKPKCSFCTREIQFVEGDIIDGVKWYHANCAKLVKWELLNEYL